MSLDYYYKTEGMEQFHFLKMPRALMRDDRFKGLSSDAKLLYTLMLDRVALSMIHGFVDDEDRVYIYYPMNEIMEELGCSNPTCTKILCELDSKKGIGLIERKRQGQGKPDRIYVKVLVESEQKETSCEDNQGEIMPISETKKDSVQKPNNNISSIKENEVQDSKKVSTNNTNINKTDINNNNHIYQSIQEDMIDEMGQYIEIIKENVGYENFMKYGSVGDKELYTELVDILCETVCVRQKTVRINGTDYPYELVKSKFLKINNGHLEYVMECMRKITTPIANIRAYMLTALFNAPSTINHYYQQEVQHDMWYGKV